MEPSNPQILNNKTDLLIQVSYFSDMITLTLNNRKLVPISIFCG